MKSTFIATACVGLISHVRADNSPPAAYQAPPAPCPAPAPAAPSLCDKYTEALLGNVTADNEKLLITLVVNTAIIGNYTQPNVGIAVDGILAPGTGDYAGVNLLPFFTGELNSTNFDTGSPVSFNFLDSGGADALKQNLPAFNETSGQYHLVSHLYQFFAGLLGCTAFPEAYAGRKSMYDVHEYMALGEKQVGWFIHQVGLSAASFGVTADDVTAVGTALQTTFGVRCAPPASVPTADFAPDLQSICIEPSCPLADGAQCDLYGPVIEPVPAPAPLVQ